MFLKILLTMLLLFGLFLSFCFGGWALEKTSSMKSDALGTGLWGMSFVVMILGIAGMAILGALVWR